MEPANVVLAMRQNGDFRRGFVLQDKQTKVFADFAGYRAIMHVRDACGTLLAELSTENGGIVLNAAPGSIDLFIPVETMSLIPPQSALYDFVLIAPNADRIPLFYGRAVIAKGETHE